MKKIVSKMEHLSGTITDEYSDSIKSLPLFPARRRRAVHLFRGVMRYTLSWCLVCVCVFFYIGWLRIDGLFAAANGLNNDNINGATNYKKENIMRTFTMAKMKPCKISSSEVHNQRKKELDYVRKDLSYLNGEPVIMEPIASRLESIRKTYRDAVGQHLQKSSAPIQEIVLLVKEDTTMDDVKRFGKLLRDNFGITPFQYYLHKDEGHWELFKEDGTLHDEPVWVPNLHAHIIVDKTCYEHKMVQRTKKVNGKNVVLHEDENGRKTFAKVETDAYGKTIKLNRDDMSKMQDLAAEATGLLRGRKGGKAGLDIIEFKVQEQWKDYIKITKDKELAETQCEALSKSMQEQESTYKKNEERLQQQATLIQERQQQLTALKKDNGQAERVKAANKLVQHLSEAGTAVADSVGSLFNKGKRAEDAATIQLQQQKLAKLEEKRKADLALKAKEKDAAYKKILDEKNSLIKSLQEGNDRKDAELKKIKSRLYAVDFRVAFYDELKEKWGFSHEEAIGIINNRKVPLTGTRWSVQCNPEKDMAYMEYNHKKGKVVVMINGRDGLDWINETYYEQNPIRNNRSNKLKLN